MRIKYLFAWLLTSYEALNLYLERMFISNNDRIRIFSILYEYNKKE